MKIGMVSIAVLMFMTIACSDKGDRDEKTVLARVNDETLTYEDIIYQIPPQLRENMTVQDLMEAVETWINTEVVYQRAVEMGLDEEPDVKAKMKRGVKETVAKKLIDSELSSRIVLSPVEIDSVYRTQKDRLKLEQDRFRASHILLDDYETAMAIYNRLGKGSKFEDLAADYSRDRESAKAGGDLGYFVEGQMVEPFEVAAFDMEIDEVSGIVKTDFGYHIIKLTDKISEGKYDFESVREDLKQLLADNKTSENVLTHVTDLREKANVEILLEGTP